MVYKKYVYKKGKRFGPYYYESYRDGNTVKKRYIGTSLPENSETQTNIPGKPIKNHRKLLVHLIFLVLILSAVTILMYRPEFTGYSTLGNILEKDQTLLVDEDLSNQIENIKEIVQKEDSKEQDSVVEQQYDDTKDNEMQTVGDKDIIFSGAAAPLNQTNGVFFEGWESGSIYTNNWTTTGVTLGWNVTTTNVFSGTYAARTEPANFQDNLTNNISTVNYQDIILNFYWRTDAFDLGDIYSLCYYNGTVWKTINSSLGIDTIYRNFNYSFPDDATNNPNFRIRFTCNPNNNNEFCYLDNLTISGTKQPSAKLISYSALNSSLKDVGAFNSSNLKNIEYMVLNFSLTSPSGNIDSWHLNFTANGFASCSLGNKQNNICYNYSNSNYRWIQFINNTNTGTYDAALQSQGDSIFQEIIGSGNQINVSYRIDEHYNPNVFKWYNALYNFSDVKWQNAANQRITNSTMIKIELNQTMIPLDADQYKLDFRINYSGNPQQPLASYVCNSSYNPGDNIDSEKCALVAQKFPNQLQDDGTKHRAIFTKELINNIGNIRYVLLLSGEPNLSNYYYLKTYKATASNYITHWEYSNNYGINWNNLNDSYETELNLNWFYDGAQPTAFIYKMWVNTSVGTKTYNEGNITWNINATQNYPPLLAIIRPGPGSVITLPYNITFDTEDPNNDNLNTTLYLYKNGQLNKTLATNMNQSNTSYYWFDNTPDGDYDLVLKTCELSTTDLFCVNDTHHISLYTSYPLIFVYSPQNTSYGSQSILINFTSNDSNLDSLWYYNGTANTTYTSPHSIYLDYGSHTFIFYANNTIGTLNSSSVTFFIATDSIKPGVSLISPAASVIDVDGNITFNCSATDNLKLKQIHLYFEELSNQTRSITGTSANEVFYIYNLANGEYVWRCAVFDEADNFNTTLNRVLIVNLSAAPTYNDSYFNGNTTDWNAVEDITNVCDGEAILDHLDSGLIQWTGCVNAQGANFDSNIIIGQNNITILTDGLDTTFNSSARIVIKNLTWEDTPVVYRDGVICREPKCSNVSYNVSTGIAEFNVTGFTSYTTQGNSQLTIWDENDTGMPCADQVKYANDTVKFFANYTKKTDNSPITSATCIINFSDASANMNYNTNTLLYEYNRTFQNGFFTWNVSCNAQGYQMLTANDTITVLPDTIGPTIIIISPSPSGTTYLVNSTLTITANIVDTNNVNDTYLNVTLPNGTINSLTLNNTSGDVYTAESLFLDQIGRYNITFSADDVYGNEGNETGYFLVDYTLPEPPRGRGGSAGTQSAEFSIDPSLIKLSVLKGEIKEQQIKIKNTGRNTITITLVSEFGDGLVSFSEDEFTLPASEEKIVNVVVEPSEDLLFGVYEGKIIAKSKGISKEADFIITLKEKAAAIDLDVNVLEKRISLGETVEAKISISKNDMIKKQIQVYYSIKDVVGETVLSKAEKLELTDKLEFARIFEIPKDIDFGVYMFHVSIVADDVRVSDADLFNVVELEFPGAERLGFLVGFVVVAIIFGIALFIVKLIKRQREQDFFSRI